MNRVNESNQWIHISRLFSKQSWKIYIGSPNPYICRCKFSPRLQIRLLFRKTAARIAAYEEYWRLPSSPIVEKNMWFPYVNSKVYWFTHGSPNLLFYRCKFFALCKTIHFFKKFERNSPHLRKTGGSSRRQIVEEKKHVHFPYANSKVYWFTHRSPIPLFYRCKFSALLKWRTKNGHILSKPNGNRRYWGRLAAPVVANSGK